MTSFNYPDAHTEAERRALEILRDAPLREDNDYRYLASLIDDAVKDLVDNDDESLKE